MIDVVRHETHRVFIEDMPSFANLDPLIRSVIVKVENEIAMENKKIADKIKAKQNSQGSGLVLDEEKMIKELERTLK